jgi:hypothetical protein
VSKGRHPLTVSVTRGARRLASFACCSASAATSYGKSGNLHDISTAHAQHKHGTAQRESIISTASAKHSSVEIGARMHTA